MRGALSQRERPLWGRPAVAGRYFAGARQRRARARAQSRKALPSAPNQAKRAEPSRARLNLAERAELSQARRT